MIFQAPGLKKSKQIQAKGKQQAQMVVSAVINKKQKIGTMTKYPQ